MGICGWRAFQDERPVRARSTVGRGGRGMPVPSRKCKVAHVVRAEWGRDEVSQTIQTTIKSLVLPWREMWSYDRSLSRGVTQSHLSLKSSPQLFVEVECRGQGYQGGQSGGSGTNLGEGWGASDPGTCTGNSEKWPTTIWTYFEGIADRISWDWMRVKEKDMWRRTPSFFRLNTWKEGVAVNGDRGKAACGTVLGDGWNSEVDM